MLSVVWIVLAFGMFSGCGQFVYVDGPFHGKAFDPASRKPIQGAAVLAVWMTESGLLVPHPIEAFHDAQETLTDPQGNFTIRGTKNFTLNPTLSVKGPQITIFKPGHRAFRGGFTGEENRQSFHLPILKDKDERRRNLHYLFVPSDVPQSAYPNLRQLEDEERLNVGLTPMYQKGRQAP